MELDIHFPACYNVRQIEKTSLVQREVAKIQPPLYTRGAFYCPLESNSYQLEFLFYFYALPTEPKSSIFSLTVALIASKPGAKSFLGSKPLPVKSLPASTYSRVAAAKAN